MNNLVEAPDGQMMPVNHLVGYKENRAPRPDRPKPEPVAQTAEDLTSFFGDPNTGEHRDPYADVSDVSPVVRRMLDAAAVKAEWKATSTISPDHAIGIFNAMGGQGTVRAVPGEIAAKNN